MNLNTSIAVVLAAVALAIGVAMSGGDTYVTSEGQGGIGVPGVALYPQSVTTFTEGGGVFTHATSGTAYTLPATAIDTENYVAITPTGGNLTVTLPATSSFPGIPNAGDTREIWIENAATAATTTTIAAGTGMDLQEPDGQNVVIGQNNYARLSCVRMSSTDVTCVVDEVIPAD